MKVALVYNRESERVINLFGIPNREKYKKPTLQRIVAALKLGGHQVRSFEGDKDLIARLEEFMPRVVKGERPGMVFNISYGIQGQARYTHVPSILEMVGIPYVGSGPEAHSLSLDKFVAKMIFRQHNIPTPDFVVIHGPKFDSPGMPFPLIVKPRSEAVSFGLKIVHREDELREAVQIIHDTYGQPSLVEQYIDGREINVGLLGNNPPEVFAPAEIMFGEGGPPIYTAEDKMRRSGRDIHVVCPAQLDPTVARKSQEIALSAFSALGCFDCARVDMRLDSDGNLYVLELNSLPSLGEHGSYLMGAAAAGLDFPALVNRLVEVACTRYFGVPTPPSTATRQEPQSEVFNFLVENRDRMERRVEEWVSMPSRTSDPVGLRECKSELGKVLQELGLTPVREFTDERVIWAWETKAGFENGTLLIGHADVPLEPETPSQEFRKEPERLFGEGIGSSRAPLVMLEYALRALRRVRRLSTLPAGVLYHTDEGRDCRYSWELIRAATQKAKRVLVLRPSITMNHIVTRRRGLRTYWLTAQGESLALGQALKKPDPLSWLVEKLGALSKLSSPQDHLSVSPVDVRSYRIPMRLAHQVKATILMTYPDETKAEDMERRIREILGHERIRWRLEKIADRPPLIDRRQNIALARHMEKIAKEWGIPLRTGSSAIPSVAGLVPASTPVVCGIAPVTHNIYTQQEAIERDSLLQRTLLLAQYLLSLSKK